MLAEIKHCERCGAAYSRPVDYSNTQWAARRFCGRSCGNRAPSKYSDPRARFEQHVFPEPMSGCWLWDGTSNRDGYGQIRINGSTWLAHRLSYELSVGKVPDGLWVLHHCDNPSCVNPDHLYLGTFVENNRDRLVRGRSPRGERHHMSRFTEDEIAAIRKSNNTSTDLGRQYGVSRTAISNIRSGKVWSHTWSKS